MLLTIMKDIVKCFRSDVERNNYQKEFPRNLKLKITFRENHPTPLS